MKRLKRKNYTHRIGYKTIYLDKKCIPDFRYNYILIMDMNTSEYFITKFSIQIKREYLDTCILNLESEKHMNMDIKIIGFLENLPYIEEKNNAN
jgi:hypothetical protein